MADTMATTMVAMKARKHQKSLPTADSRHFRKCGPAYKLRRELKAIAYVQRFTSIPVPHIIGSHLDVADSEEGWFLMERIPGIQLGEAWPDMNDGRKARATVELRTYLKELHALRPPAPGWIGSCTGGPAYDHRIDNLATCGPFTSVAEFHDFLVAPITKCPRPEWVAKYRQRLNDDHNIIFVHADLSRENILVDPDHGTITGIIDWEMAGFWPDWWEYRKAMIGASQKWWAEVVYQVMPQFEAETEADMDIERF